MYVLRLKVYDLSRGLLNPHKVYLFYMGLSPKFRGTFPGGPHNKENILGIILGFSFF